MPTDAKMKNAATPPFRHFITGFCFLSKISQIIEPKKHSPASTVITIFAVSDITRLPATSKSQQAAKITISALFMKCIITDGKTEPERSAMNAKAQPVINW